LKWAFFYTGQAKGFRTFDRQSAKVWNVGFGVTDIRKSC